MSIEIFCLVVTRFSTYLPEAKKCKCDNHNYRLLSLDAATVYFMLFNEKLKYREKKMKISNKCFKHLISHD